MKINLIEKRIDKMLNKTDFYLKPEAGIQVKGELPIKWFCYFVVSTTMKKSTI